ncbi:hypothetical protein U9M48_012287 [Paspalum notatum var. saurae]|uniref:Reverse transcriptase domain-containing protein n=1 Tax=Paspalum notatum var. saurae TaxID=547442 RepID=A0AAQ3WIE3_PASNO
MVAAGSGRYRYLNRAREKSNVWADATDGDDGCRHKFALEENTAAVPSPDLSRWRRICPSIQPTSDTVDLDTIVSLAFLQEELLGESSGRPPKKHENYSVFKPNFKDQSSSSAQGAQDSIMKQLPTEEKTISEGTKSTDVNEKQTELDTPSEDSGDDLMVISVHVVNGTEAPRTIKFAASLAGQTIDSDNSSSFVSEHLAVSLAPKIDLVEPVQVRVANGNTLWWTQAIQNCPISVQGHEFKVHFKVLPLPCYDVILGINWLELHSLMEIHWKEKRVTFPYKGTTISIQGLIDQTSQCLSISSSEFHQLHRSDALWAIPFRLHPYRYNTAQKDEIEVNSPFASPVILAKKKTCDWRLCLDYRRLNALTVKNKYPLPIIDELLDELTGAKWFTSLDLSSGYHQIQMDPKDIFKTAFQTHNGHFKYRVMPYGVTGGPTIFQLTMNYILAPLLRKCVVVFIDDIVIYSKNWLDHLHHIKVVFTILKEHL